MSLVPAAPIVAALVAVSASASVGALGVAPPRALAPVTGPGAAPASSSGWSWPVASPEVVRAFDPPSQPWLAGHRGVDLSASDGAAVVSPGPGRVTYASSVAGRGVVVVAHPGGLRSTLEPVRAGVPVGTTVATGEVVGTLEDAPGHCAPARCLHWGVLRGRTYLDPVLLVQRREVVLLPLG